MYKKRSKRYETWRIIFILVGMPLLAGVLLTLATLYMIDYRFNFKDREVTQGGLVQFDSHPRGAAVSIDGKMLSGNTPTRINTSAGSHTVSMTLKGYAPWQKTVTVEPGKVLWLNYTRFIPENITTSVAAKYQKLAQILAVPNTVYMYVLVDAAQPQITQLQATNSLLKTSTFDIATDLLTVGKGSHFKIVSSDASGKYLLVEHKYGKDTEWLYIDVNTPTNSLNISRLTKQPISEVKFDASNSRALYTLIAGSLYYLDTTKAALSTALVQNISNYEVMSDGTLLYATTYNQATARRDIGYLSPNASVTKTVRTFYGNKSLTIDFIGNKYFNANYFAIKYGTTLEINTGTLPASDSGDAVMLSSIATIALTTAHSTISFSPTSRFILVDSDVTFMTYDLELNKLATITQRGDGGVSPIEWLDNTSLLTTRGGQLQYYEFDGENSHPLMRNARANSSILSPDNNSLYSAQNQADGGVNIMRLSILTKK